MSRYYKEVRQEKVGKLSEGHNKSAQQPFEWFAVKKGEKENYD